MARKKSDSEVPEGASFAVTADRAQLAAALERAASVAEDKSTMQALKCVSLREADGFLEVEATDLSIAVNTTIEVAAKKSGAVLVNAMAARDAVKQCREAEVQLYESEAALVVKSGARKFKLRTQGADDFPSCPSADGAVLGGKHEARELLASLKIAAKCASRDPSNPQGKGCVLWRYKGDVLYLVSTDGHRLRHLAVDASGGKCPDAFAPILAGSVDKIVSFLASLGDAEVKTSMQAAPKNGSARLHLSGGGVAMSAVVAASSFPPYETFFRFGDRKEPELSVSAKVLADTLAAARQIDEHCRVSFSKSDLRVVASHPDVGDFEEDVAGSEYSGPAMDLKLSSAYLLETLSAVGTEKVRVRATGKLEPIFFFEDRESELVEIVMPMNFE